MGEPSSWVSSGENEKLGDSVSKAVRDPGPAGPVAPATILGHAMKTTQGEQTQAHFRNLRLLTMMRND